VNLQFGQAAAGASSGVAHAGHFIVGIAQL
jgi:hypothetical protein